MSFEAAAWAINQQTKTQSAKLVLIGLSDCHNRDTGKCDPGNQYLMRIAQCSPRAINNAIAELEDLGLIEASRDPGRRTEYRLNIWKSSATVALAQSVRRRNQCGGVAQPLRGGSALCDIPFSIEPGRNQEGTSKDKQAPPIGSDPVIQPQPSLPAKRKKADNPIFSPALMDIPDWLDGELWAAWCEERAAKRKPITYRAGQLQLKKLAEYRDQGFSPQEVIEHSIASGYQGLFPPRGNQHANNQSANQPYSVGDRVRAAISKNAREREQRQNLARERGTVDVDGAAMDTPF